jgi:hypothetical protein
MMENVLLPAALILFTLAALAIKANSRKALKVPVKKDRP